MGEGSVDPVGPPLSVGVVVESPVPGADVSTTIGLGDAEGGGDIEAEADAEADAEAEAVGVGAIDSGAM